MARIDKDMRIWRKLGVTEERVLKLQHLCGRQDPANFTECHIHEGFHQRVTPRFLISGGNVFLTQVVSTGRDIGGEPLGFMQDLYEVSRIYELPDMEFAYYNQDGVMSSQLMKKNQKGEIDWDNPDTVGPEGPLPLIVFSKTEEHVGMLVGVYSGIRCSHSYDFDSLYARLHSYTAVQWTHRKPVAFGRWNNFCAHYLEHLKFASGKRMMCARESIHSLSKMHPSVLDAGWIGNDGKAFVPLHEQLNHKYIISTDGWAASSKLERYLLLGSVLLKQESPHKSWFYDMLQPYGNYVPFYVQNETDILQVIQWLRTHDEEAQRIAEAGQRLAVEWLNKDQRQCYLFHMLNEFGKTFKYKPDCSRRQMCVPLITDIKWLSEHHPHDCKYAETLLRWGKGDPLSKYNAVNLTHYHQADQTTSDDWHVRTCGIDLRNQSAESCTAKWTTR